MSLKPIVIFSPFALMLSLAHAAEQDHTSLDAMVVTGNQLPYMRLSETATKTDQDLLDTPLSVSIINQTLIEDIQAQTLADVYPYIVGLSQSGTNANSFTLRGLSSDLQNVQVNGLPGLASRFGSPSTANIERVEVLKGPASVLYGLMEPGGLVNIVTKRPELEDKTSFSISGQSYASDTSHFGSDTGATLTYDSTGSLTDDNNLLYRFIASVENIDSFRDGVNYNNIYLYPTLSYQFNPDLKVTVGMEYVREKGDADDGLVAVNNDINTIASLDTRYQEKGDYDNDEGLIFFGELENQLNSNTTLKVNLRSVFHEDERKLYENNRVNDAVNVSDSTLRRRDRHQLNKRQYHFIDTNLAQKFTTGSFYHSTLVGINMGFERSDYERIRFGSNISPNIDVYNPITGLGTPSAIQSGSDRVTDYYNAGIYLQDTIDLTDALSIMLGARYDQQYVRFQEQVSGFNDKKTTGEFLPQGGIVYRINDQLSVYGSHTESFYPNSIERRSATNSDFSPEKGNQNEVGIKAALFDEKLNMTLAGFKINKSNIVETNSNGDYELLGDLESRGYEFEVQALPIENWQIKLGYANVDSIVSKSANANLIGKTNAFAPRHNAFLWTRFNFPERIFGGKLGTSLGINYKSKQVTNANETSQVELPSYTRVDFGMYYDIKQYQIGLNIENVFDKTYFTGGTTDRKIYPGDPRLVTLSFKTQF
jgi:iron complex outermembrane receptor protein